MKSLVSIIVPVYNAERTIDETINSVISQTYTQWELILINDGSTDNSEEKIKSFNDARIIYHKQKNQGVASARNLGLRSAKGDLIAFLDSDDLWSTKKLSSSIELIQRSHCDLVYTKIRMFTDSVNTSVAYEYSEPINEENDYYRLLIFDYIPTLTVVIKKDVLDDIGYFDSSLYGTEDWDLWIRVAKKYKIKFLSEELAFYRYLETGISKNRNNHLLEEFKVIKKHVLNNNEIPKSIKCKALWVWNKKNFFNSLKRRNYLTALFYYAKMQFLLPLSAKNIRILFNNKNV